MGNDSFKDCEPRSVLDADDVIDAAELSPAMRQTVSLLDTENPPAQDMPKYWLSPSFEDVDSDTTESCRANR